MEGIIVRTPDIIAAEINTLKDQARRMAVIYCIEIGRRLVEAKAIVAYGSWGDWLQSNVAYSQSTANNFIRLFEEYGPAGGLLGGEADLQALGNLNYTQAVALLAVPADERAAFMEEHDVENISTRELQQAIKERDEAKEDARESLELFRKSAAEKEELQKKLEEKQKAIDQISSDMAAASKEHRNVKKQLEQAQKNHASDEEIKKLQEQLETAQRQVKELSESLEQASTLEQPEAITVETTPPEVIKELEDLRGKAKSLEDKLAKADAPAVKFTVHFDQLKEAFRLLLVDTTEMIGADREKGDRYKGALLKTLDTMKERL